MGKGGGSNSGNSGPSESVYQGMLQNSTALVDIAQQQSANSKQLFNLTEPGLKTAEDFYSTLASGDPAAILRATAPEAQQTAQASAGAKSNILATAPQGGERNLALEEVDVKRGATNAGAATGSVLGAPNALASLAGQGIGASISAAGTGIRGISSANQGLSSLGNLQLGQEQVHAQEKGNLLGFGGGLAGDLTTGLVGAFAGV
jgi:hypothetical protein